MRTPTLPLSLATAPLVSVGVAATRLAGLTLFAVVACSTSHVWAQSAAPPAARVTPAARPLPPEAPQNSAPSSSNQLIERIQVENRDVRIDEVRFGGETRSISVAPKGGWPTYDVQPTSGERTWKVLGF